MVKYPILGNVSYYRGIPRVTKPCVCTVPDPLETRNEKQTRGSAGSGYFWNRYNIHLAPLPRLSSNPKQVLAERGAKGHAHSYSREMLYHETCVFLTMIKKARARPV